MTNGANYYDIFIGSTDKLQELGKVVKPLEDSRSKIKDDPKVMKAVKEQAYKIGVEDGLINPNEVKSAGDLDDKQALQIVQLRLQRYNGDSNNVFYNNLDSIVDSSIPAGDLEKLAGEENIIGAASEKDRKVLQAYGNVKGLEDLIHRYNAGKQLRKEEMESVIGIASQGAAEEGRKREAERQASLGYSDKDLQNAFASVYVGSLQQGYLGEGEIKKYAQSGLNIQLAEISKKYQEQGIDVLDVVRNSLKKLGKGSNDEFNLAKSLVYGVHKDSESKKKE